MGRDLPLEAVERVLKFFGQLRGQFFLAYCAARGHQVGDRADVIPSCLHGHVLQIEPGVTGLVGLVFPLLLSKSSGEPVSYKPREAILFDHANPVEIKVTAVLLSRSRMENIRALESQLLR